MSKHQQEPSPGRCLEGRVALVTGGSRGIGAAISARLAAAGATVAAGYSSNLESAEQVAGSVRDAGGQITLHQGNISDPEQCLRVFDEVIDQHGRLDILVNNAGITLPMALRRLSVEDWHKVLRVNLSGAFYLAKPALDHMLQRGSGRIINISSVVGQMGLIGQAPYAASKGGMHAFTMTLAREAAHELERSGRLGAEDAGLTVNAVAPGFIETDMAAGLSEAAEGSMRAQIPVRRFGRADEIARVVEFLAQDGSSYITGQVWGVNGGMHM